MAPERVEPVSRWDTNVLTESNSRQPATSVK